MGREGEGQEGELTHLFLHLTEQGTDRLDLVLTAWTWF